MADARFDTVTLEIGDSTVLLRYYGEHKVFAGFTAVYEEGSDEIDEKIDSKLPRCEEGSPAALKEISPEQHFTQPPSRYTEASLVKELEELGIGRPSTYAPTISTIQQRGYVVKEDRDGQPRKYRSIILKGEDISAKTLVENAGAERY